MEGWFPVSCWFELNRNWAGLGQLLNIQSSKKVMAEYVDRETASLDSPWRVVDKASFIEILKNKNKNNMFKNQESRH